MGTTGLKMKSRVAGPPLPRAVTDPLVSWAMSKENLEELWVRNTTQCVRDPNLVNVSLVMLLNGWNTNTRDARARVRAMWTKVAARWDRELSTMSVCDVEIGMLHITDGDQLRQMAQFGTRLFVAV